MISASLPLTGLQPPNTPNIAGPSLVAETQAFLSRIRGPEELENLVHRPLKGTTEPTR